MRRPLDSPFSPGADTVPEVWAGRTKQLSEWRDIVRHRRIAGTPERGRTILGEAGMGKSSLVRRIAREASEAGDWVTPQLRIPSGTDPLKRLASALLELAATAGLPSRREKRISHLLSRVESVSAAGLSFSLRENDGPEAYTVLTELLVEIGRAARSQRDTMILIHIDAAQNITDEKVLSQLLIALGDTLSHVDAISVPGGGRVECALPVEVYLTGLPEFADMAGARKGATFARRFATTTLAPLSDEDLEAALQPFLVEGWPIRGKDGTADRVHMDPQAIRSIVELSCGEPFLFQLAGERAWYADTDLTITPHDVMQGWEDVKSEAAAHVSRILSRLPGREREFLEAMAELSESDSDSHRK